MGLTQRRRNRLIIAAAKDAPCPDCGRSFPAEAMDFDHVRGLKLANVSALAGGPTPLLLAEMAKCVVVCASCHRSRTLRRELDAHVDAALDADSEIDLGLP